MLNEFSAAWNNLYKDHPSEYLIGSVTITELDEEAKNKTFMVRCSEVVSFPSKQFNGYDMFGALTDRNCDGVLLIANPDGTCDLLYIEMKSRFSLQEVYKAKKQIVETCTKMQSLLQMIKDYTTLPIKRVYGVIETKKLDDNQEDWWLKQQMLPEEDLQFGERLLKHETIQAPTHCKKELNMPASMTFRILLSDDDNFSVNYSDVLKTTYGDSQTIL